MARPLISTTSSQEFKTKSSDEILGFLLTSSCSFRRVAALLWRLHFASLTSEKFSPANGLEQLSRGHIVLDEVMAGLYTLICLRLLLKLGWA
jgi:phosphatidylglycerophosphatase A